jgi:hypothetical protein
MTVQTVTGTVLMAISPTWVITRGQPEIASPAITGPWEDRSSKTREVRDAIKAKIEEFIREAGAAASVETP